jgi:hypothetical protein
MTCLSSRQGRFGLVHTPTNQVMIYCENGLAPSNKNNTDILGCWNAFDFSNGGIGRSFDGMLCNNDCRRLVVFTFGFDIFLQQYQTDGGNFIGS